MQKIELTEDISISEHFEKFLSGEEKGIIRLAAPIANINEWKGINPAVWPVVLGITEERMERILYFGEDVIDDPGDSGLTRGTPVPYRILEMLRAAGKTFIAKSGFDGLEVIMDERHLPDIFNEAREDEKQCMAVLEEAEEGNELEKSTEEAYEISQSRSNLEHAREMIDAIIYAKAHLDRFKLTEINVLPMQIRSILNEEIKTMPYALDDLTYLYHTVCTRNDRLKRLNELGAPDIIIRNEKRMLQERVDSLIANGKRGTALMRCEEEGREIRMQSLTDVILRNIRPI